MAAPRLFQYIGGRMKAVLAIATSAGAADVDKIPALDATGKLDLTFLNTTITSAGAADSAKLPRLDAGGKLDNTVMPTGLGAATIALVASEALTAGNWVNVWNNAGVANVRKADATTEGKEVHGFVLASFAAAASATVYLEGQNNQLATLTPGARQYLAIVAGTGSETAPVAAGNVVQQIGVALNATTVQLEAQEPITLV